MKSLIKISMFLCFFILTSCYESLDFNQLKNHVSKPVFTSALTYFTVVPAKFFDSSGLIQKNSISDITDFQILNNTYFKENVVKIDFNAEIKNEFDRIVTFRIDFLNNNSTVVYSFKPIIVASKDLNYTYLEEIVIATTPNILKTTKVRITAELENTGIQMNPLDTSEFVFKSSVTLYVEAKF